MCSRNGTISTYEDDIFSRLLSENTSRPTVQLVRMKRDTNQTLEKVSLTKTNVLKASQCILSTKMMEKELKQMNVTDLVIGDIVEREWPANDLKKNQYLNEETLVPKEGFPQASKRSGSIFLKKNSHITDMKNQATVTALNSFFTDVSNKSFIEKQQYINDLESLIGKPLLDQLKKKSEKKLNSLINSAENAKQKDTEIKYKKELNIQFDRPFKSFNFIIDEDEANKLLWTMPAGSLATDEQNTNDNLNGIASRRFHLNGDILISDNDENVFCDPELYHHGKQPHLPGYTLVEIIDFWMPSVNTMQRQIGLQTILNIVLKSYAGSIQATPVTCHTHSSIWQEVKEANKYNSCIKRRGFGHGLLSWHQFVFETLELHFKVWKCFQSSCQSVRILSLQLLNALFLPETKLTVVDCCDIIDSIQPPLSSCYSLQDFSSSYRRILLKETMPLFFSGLLLQQTNLSLDESSIRLVLASDGNMKEKCLQYQVKGLSAFDTILHILLAKTMHDYKEDWITQAEPFLSDLFKQLFGDASSETILVHFLIVFLFHSYAAFHFILQWDPTLVVILQTLVKSLTIGTNEAEKREQIIQQMDYSKNDNFLTNKVLFFLQCLSHKGIEGRSHFTHVFPDTMVPLIFVRQNLMKNLQYSSVESLLVAQALSTIIALEQNEIWKEEFDCFYEFLLVQLNFIQIYARSFKKNTSSSEKGLHKGAIPMKMWYSTKKTYIHEYDSRFEDFIKVATMICKYCRTALVNKDLDVLTLAMVLKLNEKTASLLKFCVFHTKKTVCIRFVLELLHTFTVLSSSLLVVWNNKKNASQLTTEDIGFVEKFSSVCREFHLIYGQLDGVWNIFNPKNFVSLIMGWAEHSAVFSPYTSIPFLDEESLDIFLRMGLCSSACHFEYQYNTLLENTLGTVKTKFVEDSAYFCFTSVSCKTLLSYRQNLLQCIEQLTKACVCVSVCQGNQNFCGASDVIRVLNPVTCLTFDTLSFLDELLLLRNSYKDSKSFKEIFPYLMTASTTIQLDKAFEKLFQLSLKTDLNHSRVIQFWKICSTGYSHQSFGSPCIKKVIMLSCNPYLSVFRYIHILIQLYYNQTRASALLDLDQFLTWFLFETTEMFHYTIQHCTASTVIEQLLLGYSTLQEGKHLTFEALFLEKAFVKEWGVFEQCFFQEISNPLRSPMHLAARLEFAVTSFLPVIKHVPDLPRLSYLILSTIGNIPQDSSLKRLVTSDSQVMTLLHRRFSST